MNTVISNFDSRKDGQCCNHKHYILVTNTFFLIALVY